MIESFRTYLRDNNLPVTAQRLTIAEVVLGSDRHLSVDEVIRAVISRGTSIGTATVYRTLDVLVRSGLVVERDFGEGFKRYEPARGDPHHEHLVCTSCGRVVEIRDEQLGRMTASMAESHGFRRDSHRLVISGVCGECQGDGGGALPPPITAL